MSFDETDTAEQDQDKIVINVGGKRHQSYLSTLRNIPDTRLSWLAESYMNKQEQQPRKEIFFDRHPDLFAIILNYYRTGKLHAPRDVCGPLFEEELAFWGIEEMEMEACCWPNYAQHRDAEKNLLDFVGPEFEDEDDDDFDKSNEMGNHFRYQPQVWAILDDAFSSRKAKVFAMVSLAMILLSIILMCTGSVESVRDNKFAKVFIQYAEYFFCAWFTLELLIRIIFCPSKLELLKKMMTWIDIISLLPYYYKLGTDGNTDLDFLRSIRLIRLFRVFRFFRFTSGLQIIVQSLKASFRELLLLVIILLIPVVLFSSIIYDLEKNEEGNAVKFSSIPQSFWWAVITMTTVGYGDMSPRTIGGQLIGSVCAICGVLIIGLPVSVIGNNFSTYYEHAQARLNLPKKKRRIIMGDANRIFMQSNSHSSSAEHDRDDSINVPIPEDAVDDDQEFERNYRRFHRRSRKSIFARGDVYAGQTARKKATLPATRENSDEENEEQQTPRTPELDRSSVSGEKLPRNYTLINSTHESEEIIEETSKTWNNPGCSDGALREERRSARKSRRNGSTSSRTRSKSSIELKTLDTNGAPASPRPGSSHSFRSRVTPTPTPTEQSCKIPLRAGSPRSMRVNTSFMLPSLSTTHLRAPGDNNAEELSVKNKRHSDNEINFDNNHRHSKENGRTRPRERTLQNGNIDI